ncbi:MAG: YceK/YidQ family lipoprotein, partial [Planctomycetes bacterium]|nr:YceK/YidQ family lipoprotein [Planctomycetota bacterium]
MIEWSPKPRWIAPSTLQLAIVLACVISASGCGTVISNCMLDESEFPAAYRGTTLDFLAVTDQLGCCGATPSALERVLLTLDLPLSLVADTVVLPWNLLQWAQSEDLEPD